MNSGSPASASSRAAANGDTPAAQKVGHQEGRPEAAHERAQDDDIRFGRDPQVGVVAGVAALLGPARCAGSASRANTSNTPVSEPRKAAARVGMPPTLTHYARSALYCFHPIISSGDDLAPPLGRLLLRGGGSNYTHAAREFPYPISQPGVYQQVRKLEQDLGSTLFERVGRDRVELTAQGARCSRSVRRSSSSCR